MRPARLRASARYREQLLAAAQVRDPSRVENSALYFGPVLDARNVPVHPFWPTAPLQSAKIPLVIGNTRDETRAFLGNDAKNFALSWDELPARLETQQYVDLLPQMVIAEYRRLYPQYSPSDVFFAATTAGRSWRGAVEEAEARARQGAPTWVYQLDWGSPLDGGKFGAFHTLDIPLVFDTIAQPGSRTGDGADAQRMAEQMSEALIAFARSGDRIIVVCRVGDSIRCSSARRCCSIHPAGSATIRAVASASCISKRLSFNAVRFD